MPEERETCGLSRSELQVACRMFQCICDSVARVDAKNGEPTCVDAVRATTTDERTAGGMAPGLW